MKDWTDFGVGLLAFIMLAMFGIYGYTLMTTKRACLAAGYPAAQVSFAFERYCIKRVDQTDVVVPFEGIGR